MLTAGRMYSVLAHKNLIFFLKFSDLNEVDGNHKFQLEDFIGTFDLLLFNER